MITGVTEEMAAEEEEGHTREQGLVVREVKAGQKKWTVVAVYVNRDMSKKVEELRRWMENQAEGERVIIGGDFNARTGTEGRRVKDREEEGEKGRRSKDRMVNREGRRLVKLIEEVGWQIQNGDIEGVEEGEHTYTGARGATVIDYVLGDENTRRGIESIRVEDRVESDHQPVVTMTEGRAERKNEERRKRRVENGRRE